MISATIVKELRELSGAGMMDCKKALQESNGDIKKAMEVLRKNGIAKAQKKVGRSASDGVIIPYIHPSCMYLNIKEYLKLLPAKLHGAPFIDTFSNVKEKGKEDLLAIFESEQVIKSINPDFRKLSKLNSRGLIISAQGANIDFVSRFFAPQSGINEDSVTGSAHTLMIPYWAEVLKKNILTAYQCSSRGGYLKCQLLKNRVLIGGSSVRYMDGKIALSISS